MKTVPHAQGGTQAVNHSGRPRRNPSEPVQGKLAKKLLAVCSWAPLSPLPKCDSGFVRVGSYLFEIVA